MKLSNLFILIVSLFSGTTLNAQIGYVDDPNYGRGRIKWGLPETMDTAKWEMVYAHVMKDPIMKKDKTDFEMLTIGEKFYWYGGYGDFQMDSIQRVDPERVANLSFNESMKLYREFEPITVNMLISLEDNKLNYYGKIYINHYRYEEPIPEFKWRLEAETREVMGYECFKATTNWRGREWTAWYCDIPVSAGPWKFNGLPGLILRLEDASGSHLFEAIEIKNDIYPFGYNKKAYCKTTREKYNEGLQDYKENAGKIYADSGMVKLTAEEAEKMRKKRQFFCPIELE